MDRDHTGLERAWGEVLDTDDKPRDLEEVGVVELTALLRESLVANI